MKENSYLLLLYISGTVLLLLFAIALFAYVFVSRQKQNRFRLEQQQREFDYQSRLLKAKLDIQERSLKMLSEEIHDNINQALGLARIKLFLACKKAPDELAEIIKGSLEIIEQTIKDLRNISHSLNNEMVKKQGLYLAIAKQLEPLEAYGIETKISLRGEPAGFPSPEEDVLIFRIVQEALKNTVTHAKATLIKVGLFYQNNIFLLYCEDNGHGFYPVGKQADGGIGLINMRERAALLGAELSIDSASGNGTRVKLTLRKHYDKPKCAHRNSG